MTTTEPDDGVTWRQLSKFQVIAMLNEREDLNSHLFTVVSTPCDDSAAVEGTPTP